MLQAPTLEQFMEDLGVEPTVLPDGDSIELDLRHVTGEDIRLRYSQSGSSVSISWNKHGQRILGIFREGASRILLSNARGTSNIIIEFSRAEMHGNITMGVYPTVSITDALLYS